MTSMVHILLPDLKGKVLEQKIIVPFAMGSLIKLYITVQNPVKIQDLMTPEFWESNVLSYCNRKTVASSNFIGETFSTVDLGLTSVMGKKFMTIGLWCDSETVEANGLLELYKYISIQDHGDLRRRRAFFYGILRILKTALGVIRDDLLQKLIEHFSQML
ncbi:uncharacterized protein LOC100571336 [Acyrthosiphon pisum]|uniref:Uncharacterized protein n=1 Tax=Acyrthosiphon pisum TaxID=7029 RepID=A0A8R2NXY7_ACYPI|nr:uncharacterized protein LOC107885751 [Acyrthosiphon pisum]XP_029348523.1 uncharacterized protein LOC100571336 [Acyrthosiphon pisum]